RRSRGTFAPETRSNTETRIHDAETTSRTRRLTAPVQSPSAEHENAHTAMTSARDGTADAATWTSRISAPPAKQDAATTKPFASAGIARPRKRATRFAGDARSIPSVRVYRSPLIDPPIPRSPGSAAASNALPTTKYVSLAVPVARPR